MAILVVGGAGYIGSHTVYQLIEHGREVIVADSLQTGHKEAIHKNAKFYRGDIRERNFTEDIFKKENIEAVIHFAADSLVGESMIDPLKYYDNNVYGTMQLLKSMIKNEVKKIVFSSSAAVYGEPESLPIVEDDTTLPTNTYGETKLTMERMFHWSEIAHDISFVPLRY
ncbi:MAG: NAD-dependent epimerase/dehydratase family protein, partial [Clostridiales bacterium]